MKSLCCSKSSLRQVAKAAHESRFLPTQMFEGLEERRLFATLGLAGALNIPFVAFDGPGGASYDASTQIFSVTATGYTVEDENGEADFDPLAQLSIKLKVDSSGTLISGVTGADLELTVEESDGSTTVLLEGEINPSGFAVDSPTLSIEALFTAIGGTYNDSYFQSPYANARFIGVQSLLLGRSSLSFASSFDNLQPKGFLGSFPGMPEPQDDPASVSGYVYHDANDDGVLGSLESGLEGVSVALLDEAGNLIDTAVTDATGFYRFTNLLAGNYQVVEGTGSVLASYLDGKESLGSLGGVVAANDRFALTLASGDIGVGYNFGEIKPSSLSGSVYVDCNCDGIRQAGETGIAGVIVALYDSNNNLIDSATTDSAGNYSFLGLRPGTYSIVQNQGGALSSYVDGKDTLGTINNVQRGLKPSNDKFEVSLGQDETGIQYNFGENRPASLSGFVWVDFNDDGAINFNEDGIAGVTIKLYRQQGSSWIYVGSQVTNAMGYYAFDGLSLSVYKIVELQPCGSFEDGQDSLGKVNGVRTGTVGCDFFSNVTLTCGASGEDYNFGERPVAGCGIRCGDTGSVCFYASNSGKNLIRALNGGPSSTQLGNWLAATFPNMYGAAAGSKNLAGKTNAEVHTAFMTRANSSAMRLDAQVMALALSVYVTSSELAGTVASSYGFRVSQYGVGARSFSIFGCCSNVQVLDLLLCTDAASRNGVLYNGDSGARALALFIYTIVNEAGDSH